MGKYLGRQISQINIAIVQVRNDEGLNWVGGCVSKRKGMHTSSVMKVKTRISDRILDMWCECNELLRMTLMLQTLVTGRILAPMTGTEKLVKEEFDGNMNIQNMLSLRYLLDIQFKMSKRQLLPLYIEPCRLMLGKLLTCWPVQELVFMGTSFPIANGLLAFCAILLQLLMGFLYRFLT